MNFRTKITIILSGGLLIVLVVGVNAYRTVRQLVTLNNSVIHTQLVVQKTQQMQAQLTSLDNDLRGHLLTENSFFKADYDQNARLITNELMELQRLTSDNPVQQKRLLVLVDLMRRKLSQTLPVFKPDAVRKGNARLDSIRAILDMSDVFRLKMGDMQREEEQLLVSRNAKSDYSANSALLVNGLSAAIALALIGWAIYLLLQTLEDSNLLNKKLQDSEEQIKQFLDAVPISVVVLDATGKFYYANKAATQLFGNTATFFDTYTNVLQQIELFRSSDGQVYPFDERPIYRALRGETTQIDDIEMRFNDRSVQIMTSASPIHGPNGALQYVISSSVDISDRAQSERRLLEAKEMAEEAARLKENFLANMSHEIRTPLNAVLGFTNLLGTTVLDDEQKEFLAAVRMAGKNLLTIVNDILDISKIEAGMLTFESIPFNISALLDSIHTMFLSAAAEKNLKLRVDTDQNLPPVLLGDPTRLTQILLNLISNALKFTKEGGVTITTRSITQTSHSVRVRFVVEDTGIGIAEEVLPAIFGRFQQATNFTTRFYGGTGLGLNIVKSLTEMQGGSVLVESTLGVGSRFTVEITYFIAEEQPEPAVSTTNVISNPDGHQLRILVVEDNIMNQKLAAQVLKRLGYHTLIAENGYKAIEFLESGEAFDAILMDIQMPVMDGYETTRYLRNKLNSPLPIIAMTAHALASERELCLQAGMNDFIPKPFQTEELQRVLLKYLTPAAESAPPVAVAALPVEEQELPKASFSVESLMQTVNNDAEFAAEMLELFLSQTTAEIKKIEQALLNNDGITIGRILHTQKVPVQMFAMTEAAQLIVRIESMLATNHDVASITPLVRNYIDLLHVEMPFIQTVLATTFNRAANA